ncbi:MAG: DEAD/DEAH box helicase [Opitutaceae bacterium]|jgi:non-specific serine/threonine protein kinase
MEVLPSDSPWLDAAIARRMRDSLHEAPAAGLLHLATHELDSFVPQAATWWRNFGRLYVTRLCHTPNLDQAREFAAIPVPSESELAALIDAAPPMRGGEYLNTTLLERLWLELDALVRAQIASHEGGASAWLQEANPLWRLIGRVTFHLAEQKNNPEHPFAFMASYASRLSTQSRVQHLPLGRALQEFAGAQNRAGLLKLLSPVEKAAEKSELIRQLLDSRRIFKALAWRPAEAYRFLQDSLVFEEAGIVVRLPDWWKDARPSRPKVSVRVGSQRVTGVGAEALLDFSASVTLEGEALTPEELKQLLSSAEGLVFVRGRWVEVDAGKLRAALDHWKDVQQQADEGGISFFEGMRLLSGFSTAGGKAAPGASDATETGREWAGLEAGDWLSSVLETLRDPARLKLQQAIPGLQATLRPYQQTGVQWLCFISHLGLGGCLADDMGLGKTVQVLALLLLRKAEWPSERARRPSLLVAPASLLANWRTEIARFASALRTVTVHPSEGTTELPGNNAQTAFPDVDFVLTTYGMVSRLEKLRKQDWDLVVLDEAQAIKNAETRQTRAVKELKASARFALTGTPVENRASDLWSLFDFINPGLLGSARDFGQYIRARDSAAQPDYSGIRKLTKPYILRRLKTDKRVISDLPEKTELSAWCGLSSAQAALYGNSVEELKSAIENAEGIQRKGLVLAFLMRFKQICNHPSQWLKDNVYAPEASGKFARLRELAEEIAERQEKALVFTQFREITEPLADFLAGIFRRPGLVLHGGTPVPKRREMVDAFQRDDGPPFFILTVKAGGTGLNLTQAAHVLHFDRWWNPAVENQATDRAFRIGQKKNVLVHKFVCRGTVEERIDRMIEEKKALSAELLEGGGEKLLSEMSNDELMRFVSLDLQRATAT